MKRKEKSYFGPQMHDGFTLFRIKFILNSIENAFTHNEISVIDEIYEHCLERDSYDISKALDLLPSGLDSAGEETRKHNLTNN